MIRIFLDDVRTPSMSKGIGTAYDDTNWIITKDYFQFVKLLINNIGNIELISFDHDLACVINGTEYTGKDAVDYLINLYTKYDIELPDWYVHTDNTSGRENILSSLKTYYKYINPKDISKMRYYHNGFIKNKFV